MERVAVVGTSGSGKTTLSRALGLPRLELDALRHQPGWAVLADDVFRARVAAFCAGERWVIDGNYDVARDLIWPRADTIVWLDLPRALVVARVVRRSLGRVLRGTELWNGNRERLALLLSRDPERSVILWAWSTHAERRAELAAALSGDPRLVRLRSRADVRGFLTDESARARRHTPHD